MNLISVIVPAYNVERYLAVALESILAQTWRDFEIILIDDGSNDGTSEIASGYTASIRYYYQENAGQASALNAGVSLARGSMLAFLDADDLWLPAKLELQMTAMEQNPAVDLVFGHVQQFISPELNETERLRLAPVPEQPEPGYLKAAMLARRSSFERVGQFSVEYRAGDFLDWYMRAEEKCIQTLMLPDLVAMRRIHQTNTAARDPGSQQDYARVIRAALQRRRTATRQGDSLLE